MWKISSCHTKFKSLWYLTCCLASFRFSHHCSECEFDVCHNCFKPHSTPLHPHPLYRANSHYVYQQFSGGWRCDNCGSVHNNPTDNLPWHCQTCEYDLCHSCMRGTIEGKTCKLACYLGKIVESEFVIKVGHDMFRFFLCSTLVTADLHFLFIKITMISSPYCALSTKYIFCFVSCKTWQNVKFCNYLHYLSKFQVLCQSPLWMQSFNKQLLCFAAVKINQAVGKKKKLKGYLKCGL